MYKVIVLFVAGSKKSAIVKVTREFGFMTSTVAQGFISLNKEVKVGDTLELPLSTKVSTITKQSEADTQGEVTTFTWVVLD